MAAPHTASYYAATARDQAGFAPLGGDLDVDVAIVGGGFTGVACAVELAERGVHVALLEANRIGWGATGRNGGQITGSLSGDTAMEREFGRVLGPTAAEYVWDLRWRGHKIIGDRVARYGIACDLTHGHLQTALNRSQLSDLQRLYAVGRDKGMGEDLTMIPAELIPEYLETDIYHGGLLNRRNMHVHSLDLCVGEARAAQTHGALIYEQTKVTALRQDKRVQVVTDQGVVTADQVILAGNAYHRLEQRALGGTLFPASLGIMATAPLGADIARAINPQNLAVYDNRFVLDYYRMTADHRLLFGGGTNYSGRDSTDIEAELRPAMIRTFPRLKDVNIDFAWSGHDGIILNRIPQVGRLGDGVFYVQGYSGHGIALSHILAEVTAEALTGDPSDFDLFAGVDHHHLPVGRRLGSLMIALGMLYYTWRDRLAL